MTTRAEGLARLRAYLETAAAWRFDPVTAHCAHFILGAIEAMTGERAQDVLSRLGIELPENAIGVARVLREHNGMRGIAESYFGAPARVDVLNARHGDIAVLEGDEGETLGIVEGGGVLCVSGTTGLTRTALDEASGFWVMNDVR